MRFLAIFLLFACQSIASAHTHTTLLNLCKPDENEYDWLDCINNNWDILDSSNVQTNASGLTTGSLPNARLDSSSVTLYGPMIPAAKIDGGTIPANAIASGYKADSIPGQAIKASTIPITALNQSGCATGDGISFNGTRWVCDSFSEATTSYPSWHKYTLTYIDFGAVATSSSVQVATLAAKTTLHAVKMKHSISFSGGSLSKYEIDIGTMTSSSGRYASKFDVNSTVSASNIQLSKTLHTESDTASWTVYATATSTGDNLDVAIQGSVDIWLLTSVSP